MSIEALRRSTELLNEFAYYFNLTGPKAESIEESRFILSNGCCYEVAILVGSILTKEGHTVNFNSHGYHAWLIVNGVAVDTLQPTGYTGSVTSYWLLPDMFEREFGDEGDGEVAEFEKVRISGYARLGATQYALAKRYGIDFKGAARLKSDRNARKVMRRLERRLALNKRPVDSTVPLPPPNAYFTDVIETAVNRPLLPYPYRLTRLFWKSRFKDLKKRNTPIWQM